MSECQLDLFSEPPQLGGEANRGGERSGLDPTDLDDPTLIASIPQASLAEAVGLATEAGRRGLRAAVPALAAQCRRLTGYGIGQIVPEQAAAIAAMERIGGREAAQAVAEMIVRNVVQGPTLKVAVAAAARLNSSLPSGIVLSLLKHADPGIRADACRCARASADAIPVLIELLDDLDRSVMRSAACALGRLGRIEARTALTDLLRHDPSDDVIDALSQIADGECLVLLGRVALRAPLFAKSVCEALDCIDTPQAGRIAARIREQLAGLHQVPDEAEVSSSPQHGCDHVIDASSIIVGPGRDQRGAS